MKIIKRIGCIILALCLVLPFAACGGGEELEMPSWLDMDADYVLTWEEIDSARSYEVEISGLGSEQPMVESSRRASYSLANLPMGDYSVRVRSVGGKRNDVFSPWSQSYSFYREYESGVLYTLINNDSEYEVHKIGSASGDVVIEDMYRGKPVTSIGNAAFRSSGNKITSIRIGKNVRTIGASAFYNCTGLESVTMPDTVVSIGESAFQNCSVLKSITLSPAITSIPDYAFAYCSALETFEIGESITSIGASAFTTCTALKSITIPDSVVSVGAYAFNENDALTEVTFGENIQTIGNNAFYGCDALTSVKFPEQLAEGVSLSVGQYAFSECDALEQAEFPIGTNSFGYGCFANSVKFADISIPETVTSIGSATFTNTALLLAQEGEGLLYAGNWLLSASEELFETLESLDSKIIHADTVGIADYAFIRQVLVDGNNIYIGCSNLWEVNLPASVKYIGRYAFYNSPKLNQVLATKGGLRKVDDYAFAECQALSNVRFSDGLLEIGMCTFSGCTILDNNSNDPRLLIPRTVTRVGAYAFEDTQLWASQAGTGAVYAGNWVVGYEAPQGETVLALRSGEIDGIAEFAFYEDSLSQMGENFYTSMSTLQSVQGLNRVRNIGMGAFFGCTSLSAISLNANMQTIDSFVFAYCVSLRRVNLPARLTTISPYAFFKCQMLGAVDLSSTEVETIGSRAFYGCRSLSINLGSSIRTIGSRAFYGCTYLTEVSIPGTVKEIGAQAFAKCPLLVSVEIGDGVERIGESAFRDSSIFGGVRIPDSVKEIGDCAFYGIRTSEIDLGNGVERIGAYAFWGTQVESLVIPASVKEIGMCAFGNCSSLRSVIFSGTIAQMDMHVFYQCPVLTVYLPEGAEIVEDDWNSSYRPLVYGCTLSDDGTFVVSVKTGEIRHTTALGGLANPVREGFDFLGWATEQGGEVRYQTRELTGLPAGQTLYAVYRYHVEEETPEETEPSEE